MLWTMDNLSRSVIATKYYWRPTNANKKKKDRPANKEKGHFKAVFQNTVFSVLNKQSIIK